eukprot:3819583-Rhodomonas_salina.2
MTSLSTSSLSQSPSLSGQGSLYVDAPVRSTCCCCCCCCYTTGDALARLATRAEGLWMVGASPGSTCEGDAKGEKKIRLKTPAQTEEDCETG